MYCNIDCETLICTICETKTFACDVFRNCPGEPEKIKYAQKIEPKEKKHVHKVGQQLKILLEKIGIKATSGCKCNDRANHIDYMEQIEPGWSEKNIEQIIDWMQYEAQQRKLPFIRTAAKMLIKLAIRNAKKQCVLCIQ